MRAMTELLQLFDPGNKRGGRALDDVHSGKIQAVPLIWAGRGRTNNDNDKHVLWRLA